MTRYAADRGGLPVLMAACLPTIPPSVAAMIAIGAAVLVLVVLATWLIRQRRSTHLKSRFGPEYERSLQQQAPVHGFFPTGIDRIEEPLQMEPFERWPHQTHAREMLIGVLERIIRYDAGCLLEDRWVLQVFAR